MIFVYKKWEQFCKNLILHNRQSIPACEVADKPVGYLVLKHDVETNVPNAYHMAKIEQKYEHRGSYYVQAYLLDNKENVRLLNEMQKMGHEISYHYDVMDSCKGNLEKAIAEFNDNKRKFEKYGFFLKTVCQHGNPVVERIGYTSNRDFFRNEKVQALYPSISDIMVNFKEMYKTDYTYYSDAGRQFKMIYDPLSNDLFDSEDRNIVYQNLDAVLASFGNENVIISTHPHRWTNSKVLYLCKDGVFKLIRYIAKILIKIPFMKKFMSRYYYLAKKI